MKHKSQQSGQPQGPSQRQLRVGEQLRQVITSVLSRGHFHDEFLISHSDLVTISEVRVSPDMKHATAYATMLGGQNLAEALTALNANADIFQKEIGHQIRMKFTPKLKFVEDTLYDSASRIDELLHNLPKAAED